MADDAEDVQSEITLDDFNADEVPAKTDSSPVKEEAKAEAKEPKAETKEEAQAEPEVKETETDSPKVEEPKVEETETDKPLGEESEEKLAPKSENRFQKLANENRNLRQQVEQFTNQAYQAQTADELTTIVNPETGEFYTRAEARVVALEQRLELKDYSENVASNQANLGNESYQVMNDFPIFNPDSEEYDKELAREAAELLDANLVRDDNIPELDPITGQPTGRGLIINSNVSPYQLYKTLARAANISTVKGQVKGQQDTEKMLVNVDSNGSVAPPTKTKDPLMDLWTSDD